MKELTAKDLAKMLGTEVENLGTNCLEFFNSTDLAYQELNGDSEKKFILDILKKMEKDTQIIGAEGRRQVWFEGWQENLLDFKQNRNKTSITPKFIRPNNIVRINGKFCSPRNEFFEKDFAKIIQLHLYDKLITDDIDEVHEFGCGSGFNLVNLSEINKKVKLHGSDFVKSSVNLIKELAQHYDINMKSRVFDMMTPDYDYNIGSNSCVFTHGAIEQLASKHESFINFLISKKPKVCFHIEPVCEVYDTDNLFDYLQFRFHKKRGYTSGLLPLLQEKAKQGKIKELFCKRVGFGSKFMEGYTIISWKSI
tara:strand:+ start:5705 stop:6631 length:927 start_codon:yes stop_codon:yes gene_type:complete